jgi:Xaa-Pro aminopeptidase
MIKSILKNKKLIDISSNLAIIRRTKTKEEIKRISNSCRIVSRVMKEIPNIVKVGMKERDLAAEIDKRMRIYGADASAFPTIVATGKNSANPHYAAGDGIIKKGEFVLVDFGCKARNYCSDVTRTFVIGTKSDKQKEILETCKLMQKEIISMLKPGVKLEDLQKKANSISEKKYSKMLHWFGHSLGIEVHDPSGKAENLEEGVVLTIEPAIYLPGFGGVRIEDDVLITKTGYKILTKI